MASKKLLINFSIDKQFQKDVSDAATAHFENYQSKRSDTDIYLNTLYILEEIAFNISLRTRYELFDEFYVGQTLPPLLKFYQGAYNITLSDLCGTAGNQVFRFWEGHIDSNKNVIWVNVTRKQQQLTLPENSNCRVDPHHFFTPSMVSRQKTVVQ